MNAQHINRYRSSESALYKAYQLQAQEHNITIEKYGIRIRVQTVGSGQPLLFIHGGPAAGSLWTSLVSLLPDYTCIILDRPGCGLSQAIPYQHLSREGLTDMIVTVVDQVLQHFQIEELPVVASSFGAYLALLYTLRRPENVSKLMLEGCPAMVEGSRIPFFMKMMLAPGLKWLMPKLPVTKFMFKNILKELGHAYSMEHHVIPEIFIDWYVNLFNHTDTQKNDTSLFSKVAPGGKMQPAFMLYDHEIEQIAKPTLWLWGKDDPFGGTDIGQRIQAKMKASSILCFDHSGHLPWLDQAQNHADAIKAFVQSQKSADKY